VGIRVAAADERLQNTMLYTIPYNAILNTILNVGIRVAAADERLWNLKKKREALRTTHDPM
jgi:hypothetical protein